MGSNPTPATNYHGDEMNKISETISTCVTSTCKPVISTIRVEKSGDGFEVNWLCDTLGHYTLQCKDAEEVAEVFKKLIKET